MVKKNTTIESLQKEAQKQVWVFRELTSMEKAKDVE